MVSGIDFIILLLLTFVVFTIGRKKANTLKTQTSEKNLANSNTSGQKWETYSSFNSLPFFHGALAALIFFIVSFVCYICISIFMRKFAIDENSLLWLSRIAIAALPAIFGAYFYYNKIAPQYKARNKFEKILRVIFFLCSCITVSITLLVFLSVVFESAIFFGWMKYIDAWFGTDFTPMGAEEGLNFKHTTLMEFLFGTHWSPQSDSYGFVPLLTGTLLITFIAITIAAPLGLFAAIYLSEYSTATIRSIIKPALEILAGIPTVVYGFFAALVVAPYLSGVGKEIGLDITLESALAAGGVMGIMIIPFVLSLSDDILNAVPQSLRDASYGLGATRSETISKVVLPAALPGIAGAILLAISRAIGETMIVVMAAGLIAKLSFNPLESVTTITAQIVDLLTGDAEFDSPKTLAAFALALTLFVLTLILNIFAVKIVKKYRETYE